MLCQFLLYSKMNQLYIYIYPLFFGFPSLLGHHSALKIWLSLDHLPSLKVQSAVARSSGSQDHLKCYVQIDT